MDLTRATGPALEVDDAVEDLFTHHTWDKEMTEHGDAVRAALAHAFRVVIEHVPPSPDRTVALRKIREARMDCNSAITYRGRY